MHYSEERAIKENIVFAQMLCTRFCHDIAGAISAVANGMDFMLQNEAPDIKEQAVDLLKLSSHEAFVKLQIYRLAYGRVQRVNDADMAEFRELISEYFIHTKSSLLWADDPVNPVPHRINGVIRQMLVNMVLTTAALLVYGGTISVRYILSENGTHHRLVVAGEHDKIKDDYETIGILRREIVQDYTQFTPQNITKHYLVRMAERENISLMCDTEELNGRQRVTLTADWDAQS